MALGDEGRGREGGNENKRMNRGEVVGEEEGKNAKENAG